MYELMKKLILTLSIALLLVSCNTKESKGEDNSKTDTVTVVVEKVDEIEIPTDTATVEEIIVDEVDTESAM